MERCGESKRSVYQWICYCKFDLIAIGGKCITAIPFCARHAMLHENEYMHTIHRNELSYCEARYGGRKWMAHSAVADRLRLYMHSQTKHHHLLCNTNAGPPVAHFQSNRCNIFNLLSSALLCFALIFRVRCRS